MERFRREKGEFIFSFRKAVCKTTSKALHTIGADTIKLLKKEKIDFLKTLEIQRFNH